MTFDKQLVYDIINRIPDYKEFLTIKELYDSSRKLAREHNDIVELIEVGPSRADIPVEALTIYGGEEKRVLAFAFPHPNEPIGSLTLEALSWILVVNREYIRRLNTTWIMVKVADIFGTKLNEGWFKGEFDIRKYVLNYYRPPPYKQVEWTFPIEYKTLKWNNPVLETKALMKLIDEWKPTHIYSLHNAGFMGTYYYVTRKPSKEVLDILKEIPGKLGVPIHKGEPETPYMKKIDEAVFLMPSTIEAYDWLEKYLGKDPATILKHGGSSYDYAKRVNPEVFELVCEVPYIYDDRLDNDTQIGIPRREILRLAMNRSKKILHEVKELFNKLEPHASPDNPFYEAIRSFIEYSEHHIKAEEKWIEQEPSLDESATVAQAFNAYLNTYWGPLLRYGLLYRAIDYEYKRNPLNTLKELRRVSLVKIDDYMEIFNKLAKYYIVPIRNLVQIQTSAIISTIMSI